jgi:hypothetical protein
MSKYESAKLIEHLKEKWKGQGCPMCHAASWSVQEMVFELREFHGGAMVIAPGPIVAIVPVTCNNCGNTVLVNALVAKLVQRDEEGKK